MTDTLTVAEVLERAADKLEQPGAWTQDAPARNKSGESVNATSSDACCFCTIGAIVRVVRDDGVKQTGPLLAQVKSAFKEVIQELWIADWNDAPDRTQPEVVAKLREAAAKAREQGL